MNRSAGNRVLRIPRILGYLFLFLLVSCQTFPQITVETLPLYEAAFERPSGWTGGDGAYSAALGGGRFLWLFGDTFVGEVKDGRRIKDRLINNSLAIQIGKQPQASSMDFFYKLWADGQPAAFVVPEEGSGWFWPYHAVRTVEGLYLFLLRFERADSPFPFRLMSTWLGYVPNPEEPPDRWVLSQRKIPWGTGQRQFGSYVLKKGEYCYIYGTVIEPVQGVERKDMILARVPIARLGDFDAWRFYSDGEWITDVNRAGRICENVASEFSVSYQPSLDRHVLVYSEKGISEYIVIRYSPTPHGPWSKPARVYRCPEAERDPRIYCYAAKGHPEIALSSEELIITYFANSTDFALIRQDAGLYRPRFLRIRFVDPGKK